MSEEGLEVILMDLEQLFSVYRLRFKSDGEALTDAALAALAEVGKVVLVTAEIYKILLFFCHLVIILGP